MNRTKFSSGRGYTLVELSVVMVLVVLIATTLVSMLSQQTQFIRWWKTQDFIAEDAPMTNAMVARLFSNADAFRIHTDQAAAIANTGATTGAAMTLGFTQPDGSRVRGLLWFQSGELMYGNFNAAGTAIVGSWRVAKDVNTDTVAGVIQSSFAVDAVTGTMLLTLTGPYGGRATYGVTPSL